MTVRRDGISRLSECLHDVANRDMVVIEANGHRVVVHVRLDGTHVLDFLDGRTGPRSGSASDHARGLQDIGDGFRGSCRDETEEEGQGEKGSAHESLPEELQA